MSPTQRSLAYLRKQGFTCAITEHWNMFAHIRQDLFGFIDIVCLRGGDSGILAIQTTSTSNTSARVKKILDNPIHSLWLGSGNRISVHGWSKKGARGKVKKWTLTEKIISDVSSV